LLENLFKVFFVMDKAIILFLDAALTLNGCASLSSSEETEASQEISRNAFPESGITSEQHELDWSGSSSDATPSSETPPHVVFGSDTASGQPAWDWRKSPETAPSPELSPQAVTGSDSASGQPARDWRDSYDMELSLNASGKRLSGVVRIAAKNYSEDAWSSICLRDYASSALDLFALDLKGSYPFSDELRESYSGKRLESGIESARDMRTGKALRIERGDDMSVYFAVLEEPLEPGSIVEMEMLFSFDIPPGAYTVSYSSDGQGLSFELANFYPIMSVYENGKWITSPYASFGESFYSRCADYKVKLSLPSGYAVAASGDGQLASDSLGIAVWEISGENMRDFTISTGNRRFRCKRRVMRRSHKCLLSFG
jgi:hypothetical protein